ncbi:hypothetical protein B0T10DRAFT_480044 [Thelonectria olida]|uniref:Uncharacterized protein n=1 Tax=Thelonectria olida TaxID=1576542 RepID=A0A9P8WB13_9HYPO|nr:hypothetical protein B0T10DRAFT_480044 [Thelonectria olida]
MQHIRVSSFPLRRHRPCLTRGLHCFEALVQLVCVWHVSVARRPCVLHTCSYIHIMPTYGTGIDTGRIASDTPGGSYGSEIAWVYGGRAVQRIAASTFAAIVDRVCISRRCFKSNRPQNGPPCSQANQAMRPCRHTTLTDRPPWRREGGAWSCRT